MKVTRWFSIDEDGQPERPGRYEHLYKGEKELAPEEKAEMSYWDGSAWRWEPDGGVLAFGNWGTSGERWRGLEAPVE